MKQATVIYDSDCGFCKWCLAVLLRMDVRRRLRPLPLGTAEANRLLADLSVAEREASWHLIADPPSGGATVGPSAASGVTVPSSAVSGATVPPSAAFSSTVGPSAASGGDVAADRDRVRFSAGAALAPVMDLVRGGRVPAALFRRFPDASERGYRWVADHRGLLGRFVGGRARRWAGRVITAHQGPTQ